MNVCILFGGISSEHEVSLRSAASVLRNLDAQLHHVQMVGITKSGAWLRYRGPIDWIESGEWENSAYCTPAILSPDRTHGGLLEQTEKGVQVERVDVAFPVLHGKNGEDGTVQGLLALAGIPCVGCDVLSSAVCMDKDVTHTLLLAAGVPKTNLVAVRQNELGDFNDLSKKLEQKLGYPMFVKPANAGSSVGVSKVENSTSLLEALKLAFEHDTKAVVEQMVHGAEIECAVMGNKEPIAAEVLGEIVPKNAFYDYAGKYLEDSTELHVPARIPADTAQRVREVAVQAYRALGCRGLARVDFFVKKSGEVILNEINTIPGFTSISMFPKLFAASGTAYSQLIEQLLTYAVQEQAGQ